MLNKEKALLLLILLLSLFLRLYTFDAGLYGDEQHTVRPALLGSFSLIITRNWGSFLYQILVFLLLPLGKMVIMARLPALVFGMLGILFAYITAKELFGRNEALFAAAYLGISPYHIYWSQFARGYTACLAFSLLSLFFLIRAVRSNRPKDWLGYILSSVFLVYSHLAAFLLLPAHAVFAAILLLAPRLKLKGFWTWDRSRTLKVIISFALIGLFLLILYLPDIMESSGTERITFRKIWKGPQSFSTKLEYFGDIMYRAFVWMTQDWKPSLVLTLILSGLLLTGAFSLLKGKQTLFILIFLSFIIPASLLLILNPAQTVIRNAPSRYFIYFQPLFIFLISQGTTLFWEKGVCSLRRKTRPSSKFSRACIPCGLILSLLLLLAFLSPKIKSHYEYRKGLPDFNGALRYVSEHVQDNAVLFLEGSFLFHYDESSILNGLPIYIEDYYKKKLILSTKFQVLSRLDKILEKKKQLWGIIYLDKSPEPVKLSGGSIKSFHKITLIRYEGESLGQSLGKLLTELITLRPKDSVDYNLLLSYLYAKNNQPGKAYNNLRAVSLENTISAEIPSPFTSKAETLLRLRRELYGQLGSQFLSQRMFKHFIHCSERYFLIASATDKLQAAVNNLNQLLSQKINNRIKEELIQMFIEHLAFQKGACLLWRDKSENHLFLTFEKNSSMTGSITSSGEISTWKIHPPDGEDLCELDGKTLKFTSEKGETGKYMLTFTTLRKSSLAFDCTINGRKAIQKLQSKRGNIQVMWD